MTDIFWGVFLPYFASLLRNFHGIKVGLSAIGILFNHMLLRDSGIVLQSDCTFAL